MNLISSISTNNRARIRHIIDRISGVESIRKQTRVIGIIGYTMLRRRIFEELKIDLVIDVGANIGQFVQSLRTFYQGDIISFEPVPPTFKILTETAMGDKKWHCKNIALGGDKSVLTIHVPTDSAMSSFHKMNDFCETKFSLSATEATQFEVPVTRLDEILSETFPDWKARNIFLKIDTQGYDLEVFKGVGNTLSRISALQSEISQIPLYENMPDWKNSLAVFEEAGFALSGLFPVTMEKLNAIEFDCLMTKS